MLPDFVEDGKLVVLGRRMANKRLTEQREQIDVLIEIIPRDLFDEREDLHSDGAQVLAPEVGDHGLEHEDGAGDERPAVSSHLPFLQGVEQLVLLEGTDQHVPARPVAQHMDDPVQRWCHETRIGGGAEFVVGADLSGPGVLLQLEDGEDRVGVAAHGRRLQRLIDVEHLPHEIRTRVGGLERVTDPPHHVGQALEDGVKLAVAVEKLVAANDGHLHVHSGDEFTDGRDLVEPVLARLPCFLSHIFRAEIFHSRLRFPFWCQTLLLDPLEHEPPEGVEDLSDQHEQGGIELRRARIPQQLRALDRHLERLHTLLLVPSPRQLLVQLRHLGHVLPGVVAHHADLIVSVVDRVQASLERVRPPPCLGHLHRHKGGHLNGSRRREALDQLGLADVPRNKCGVCRRRLLLLLLLLLGDFWLADLGRRMDGS
mmetsp:Transcript_16584/g.37874  ORF Transcript_16584/g.37874 Transcript_16584/m.37874 type:complete len:427 (-) Transcript_16584:255-1535(-)